LRISEWSSDVCSSDLPFQQGLMMKAAVLFVCLGNICRSPLAEAAFRREAEAVGLEVEIDSAGTGDWHIGHPPDARALAKAKAEGIDIAHYRARQVTPDDFHRFSHIVALEDRKSTSLNSSHSCASRMPSSSFKKK